MILPNCFIYTQGNRPYASRAWTGLYPKPISVFMYTKVIYYSDCKWDNPFGGFQHIMRRNNKVIYTKEYVPFGTKEMNHKYMGLTSIDCNCSK